MGAAAGFASSSFFEQAASGRTALHATTNKRFADAENMTSPFLYAPGLHMPGGFGGYSRPKYGRLTALSGLNPCLPLHPRAPN
jgi:hypothetical protein